MTQVEATTFQVKSWDEQTMHDLSEGSKITRAAVTQDYSGVIVGVGTVEYTMFHRGDGSAGFVGIENIGGTVDGKIGSFLVRHNGTFENGIARSDWSVVPGSGTAELAGIAGSGSFEAGHDGKASVSLSLVFGES